MAWQGAPPYYQDPNQQWNTGYPPNTGYPQGPPQAGFMPPGGYPPQGGYPQGGYPPGGYPQGGYPGGPQSVPYGHVPQGPSYGTNYSDPENPLDDDVKGFDFSDKSVRRGFIRKVYSILSVQLLITCGVIALFVFHEKTKFWVMRNTYVFYIALGVMLVTMIMLVCCGDLRRKSPTNLIVLGIFTLAESLLLGISAARFNSEEVLMAVGITAAVCIGLTLFALQTKWDFTVCGGVLFVALIIFFIFGIVAIFFSSRTLSLVYSSLGALLFSFYLIYDTQLMLGGKHKMSISPEEYVFAALNLYLDVIQIFMYILSIIGASRD
uniref:Putative n-methyl-d-aspartate receptor glutamate-binding subunit n=1 Tax=Tabanus bromius TaxID=304241 RepID=A0A0K8TNG4_TABBR